MDIFAKESFIRLAQVDSKPCISIYIPTHRAGHEVNEGQDRIAYKNALTEVEQELDRLGMKPRKVLELLTQAYELLDDVHFWKHQSDTLAVFIAPYFYMHYTLPIKCVRTVQVNDSLYLAPLLQMIAHEEYYYILALAKGGIKLYEATPYTITDIKIDDLIPLDIDTYLRFDEAQPSRNGYAGDGTGGVHGYGGLKDARSEQLKQFLIVVDNGISKLLNREHAPLILAGDKNVAGEYKKVTHYHPIMDEVITGNQEHVPMAELHELSKNIIKPYFNKNSLLARERFNDLSNTELASSDIKDVALSSMMSKIDTLLVKKDMEVWGDVDVDTQTVRVHSGHYGTELLNYAAVNTILNGGNVYMLNGNMPTKSAVAAIYRF